MPTVDVQDPVKLEMHSHLDRLMGQPLPTFQSALQGIKDWSPAHEWNQNVQNALFGLGDTIRNVGHAVMHPIDTAKNLPTPSAQDIAMAFNPAHMPTATVAGSLKNFLDPSKEKGVWYHGTAADIKQFKPELGLEKADVSGTPYQAGATFVTQNPEFAHVFAKDSPSYMIQNPERHLTPEQMKSAAEDAKKYFKETYEDMPEHRDAMIKSIEEGKPIGEAQDALTEAYKPYLPSGPNIMPVHVRVTNPFDAAVPEHIDALKKVNPELPFKDMHRTSVLEIPEVQQAIKDAGFDSFYTNEAGNRNLGLFKPEQIKSAIGNEGTYDPTNPVITKKDGGSVTVEDPVLIEHKLKLMGLI